MTREEAIAKIREAMPTLWKETKDAIQTIIPELAESEDERVRKEIIHYILYKADGVSEKQEHEWITWLEKQKEQKFTEKQDYSDLTDLERAIHRGFLVVGVENVPVTIIKETAQDCLAQMKQQNGANGNEKEIPKEQKSVKWSKEDEEMRITILQDIANIKDVFPKINIQPEFDWLKSLPERFNLQPKQKWSDDDADFINMLILHFNYLINKGGDSVETYKSYIEKLKSLRPHQYCENCKLKRSVENWKPSEEQMQHLKRCFSHGKPHLSIPNQHVLESLYNDLEKLM